MYLECLAGGMDGWMDGWMDGLMSWVAHSVL
jgi:hypothetical protein